MSSHAGSFGPAAAAAAAVQLLVMIGLKQKAMRLLLLLLLLPGYDGLGIQKGCVYVETGCQRKKGKYF